VSAWLSAHNRQIKVMVGFVFGAWLLFKALDGLGVF
jgi:hypothetical protein